MIPRLVYSSLTRRVLIVTRYRDKGRYIVASDKRFVFDVTDEFRRLRRKQLARRSA